VREEREREREVSVDVELVTQMEEEAGRLAGETTSGGEEEVGGNQEIRDVSRVYFTCDSSVVAGRAGVFQDSAATRGDPDETKNSGVQGRGCGAQIMDGQTSFIDREHFGQVEGRSGGVADGNVRGGEQSGSGDEIVVRGRRWFIGSAKRSRVDDRALKFPTTTFFYHFVG
jgi:hypothetical protein